MILSGMAKLDLTWSALLHFNSEQVQLLPNGVSGVYRLSYLHEDKNVYVFYVGKAENLKEDLSKFIEGQASDSIRFFLSVKTCYFKWAQLEGENERSSAQRQLYKFYQPACNEVMPIGDDSITINVT